jgi:hypothetical protein
VLYVGIRSEERNCSSGCLAAPIALLVGGATTLVTTGVGALVGALVPGQRWDRLLLPRVAAAVGPAPAGGGALAVRVRF